MGNDDTYVQVRYRRLRLRTQLAVARAGAEAPDSLESTQKQLAVVEGQLAALPTDLDRRDVQLAATLQLDGDALDFLWAVVARASDPLLLAQLQVICGSDARRGLSLAHYATIMGLDGARSQALAALLQPGHPLRRYRFLIAPEDTLVDVCSPLTVPPRLVAYLQGDDEPEDAISAAGGRVVVPYDVQLDDAQRATIHQITMALAGSAPVVIVVEGPIGSGRRTAIALAASRAVIAVDVGRIANAPGALEATLAAQLRECLLADAIPVIASVDELFGGPSDPSERRHLLARALETTPGPIVLTSAVRGIDLGVRGRRVLRLPWPVPETAARRQLWKRALGDDAGDLEGGLDELALRYRLGAGGIEAGVTSAHFLKEARGPTARLELHDLQEGIRNNIAEQLGELAQRIDVKQRWDDLVLPPETLDDVRGLIARVRQAHQVYEKWGFKQKMPRGIGVAALFSGPPGTGKTMVAGLLARELDLELYQVDLSKVVSKWVGETEKQLAKIFDAADAGHALLLFDEADSLFAKRTEVKSAVDRYANLEVNFLLQRVESFGGVTILTTNLDTSIDPALRRRLASHIVFHAPEHAESTMLWQRMLTTQAPVAGRLEFSALAKEFATMSGANIRNAVLAAAFMAAAEGTAISSEHLQRAARSEYRAMGRAL
ncbi:MAG: AAA family ATPase [Proteobacteria bacterium]|nr:AAA family ATPase [Pseudomonadota bacterium]